MFIGKSNFKDLGLKMVSSDYWISFFGLSWVKSMKCICIVIIFE